VTDFVVAFSTSSSQASVALIDTAGQLLWSAEREAEMAASKVCIELLEQGLQECALCLENAASYLADVGPGSFSGVRVGVMLAKALAFGRATVAGATAFDLISATETVFLPSKKGELFVRQPGQPPYRTTAPPQDAVGYGAGVGQFPSAKAFCSLWPTLEFIAPELLLPGYMIEPSISQPKQPFGVVGG
jgi:hypothetical protein